MSVMKKEKGGNKRGRENKKKEEREGEEGKRKQGPNQNKSEKH